MNVLIFGPNGSGKGTQGAIIKKKLNIAHIESGVLFRQAISAGSELGQRAKEYTEKGELVPDSITIPMVLERLTADDCAAGWLLDGFPRNPAQAEALHKALQEKGIALDVVVEILLDREIAKQRIMGRRLCENDGNHPNNIHIDAIKPTPRGETFVCRVCEGQLKTRADDQDEDAIGRRHDIYYNTETGTLGAVAFFKKLSQQGQLSFVEADGTPSVGEVSDTILNGLPQ